MSPQKQRGRVEEDVLGARGRQARRTWRIARRRAGARGLETMCSSRCHLPLSPGLLPLILGTPSCGGTSAAPRVANFRGSQVVRRGHFGTAHLSWAGSRARFGAVADAFTARRVRCAEWARTRPRLCPGLGWRETRSEGAMAREPGGICLRAGARRCPRCRSVCGGERERRALCRDSAAVGIWAPISPRDRSIRRLLGLPVAQPIRRCHRADDAPAGLLRKGPRPRCSLPARRGCCHWARGAGRARRHLVCPIVPCSLRRGG